MGHRGEDTMLKKATVLFSVMASLTCATSSRAAEGYFPTCCTALKLLNFRASPSLGADVLCVLSPGQKILLLDRMNLNENWKGGVAYCPWGREEGWSLGYSNWDGRLLSCRTVGSNQACPLF